MHLHIKSMPGTSMAGPEASPSSLRCLSQHGSPRMPLHWGWYWVLPDTWIKSKAGLLVCLYAQWEWPEIITRKTLMTPTWGDKPPRAAWGSSRGNRGSGQVGVSWVLTVPTSTHSLCPSPCSWAAAASAHGAASPAPAPAGAAPVSAGAPAVPAGASWPASPAAAAGRGGQRSESWRPTDTQEPAHHSLTRVPRVTWPTFPSSKVAWGGQVIKA